MEEAGQPLKLRYVKGLCGPYADNRRQVLVQLEGHYISGFGDGSGKVNEAEPLELLDDGGSASRELVASEDGLTGRLARVLETISGDESSYGLELLASVHWVASHDHRAAESPEMASELVSAWTPRKSRKPCTRRGGSPRLLCTVDRRCAPTLKVGLASTLSSLNSRCA